MLLWGVTGAVSPAKASLCTGVLSDLLQVTQFISGAGVQTASLCESDEAGSFALTEITLTGSPCRPA
jgi:hypothetical protein